MKKWENTKELFTECVEGDWYNLIFKIMSQFTYSSYEFYNSKGYEAALMPITCNSVSSPMGLGSDSLPVSVDLFGEKCYLADSMQFYLEYLLRQKDTKGVWYLMSTFRGEEPDNRHLNQFFHSEAEIKGDFSEVKETVNQYIHKVTKDIFEKYQSDFDKLNISTDHISDLLAKDAKYPEVTFEEAQKLLDSDDCFEEVIPGVKTITKKGEKELIKKFGGIVWITHLESMSVPFYQASNGSKASCGDLLFGIGEVVGAGERHEEYKDVHKALERHKVDASEYEWYVDMKERYPMQTSGFGLGLERYILWLLRHDDIRDIHLISRLKGIKSYL